METQHKSIEFMRAYLLGVLPDDESTALEEEYFVDRQSFHRLQSEEAALIADYLDGRLRKKERQLFEDLYLRISELHSKVEAARHERAAFHVKSRRALWMRWGIAAAAALAFVLGLGLWARYSLRKQSGSLSQTQPIEKKSLEPLKVHSAALEQGTKRPEVAPPTPTKKKSFAGVTKRNRAVLLDHSLDSLLKPGAQVFPSELNPPTVETARINRAPGYLGFALPSSIQRKKRVAVLDFDYGTVQPYVSSIYGSNQDVGRGITDLLMEKLVKDGEYSVIERKDLDKILGEQNFSSSDRANPVVVAKIGQLLGVDAVIVGSVTKFGRDDKSKPFGELGAGVGAFGISSVTRNGAKAVCAISARLVDTNSGEILAAFTGEGKSKRSGTSLIGGGSGGSGAGTGGFDTEAPGFGQTLLGEAVTQAVADVGSQLTASLRHVRAHKLVVSATVTEVTGNTLIIKLGTNTALQVGDKLEVHRVVGWSGSLRETTTSESESPSAITEKIGEGIVIAIDADSAVLKFVGTRIVKVGDVAKTPN